MVEDAAYTGASPHFRQPMKPAVISAEKRRSLLLRQPSLRTASPDVVSFHCVDPAVDRV